MPGAAARRAAPAGRGGARAGARRRATVAAWPSSPTTSAPLRRSTGRGARSSTRCWRVARRSRTLDFDEAARPLRVRARARHRRSAPAGRDAARARHGAVPRRPLGRRDGGVPAPRRRSPASSATPSLLATAAVGFEEACWRPGITDAGAVELLEEASLALGDEDSELRVMLLAGLGSRARASSVTTRRARSREERAIAMARRLGDRLGLATVLMRSYWSRGDGSLRGDARDADRGSRPRRGPRRERASGRGDGVARGRPDRSRRSAGGRSASSPRSTRWPVRLRQPFTLHVAEHYASTLVLCAREGSPRPRPPRSARTSGAVCSRAAVASGDPRHPDVRDPPRAGPPRRARRGHQNPRAAATLARGVATRLRGAAGRARDGRRRPGGSSRASARRASRNCAPTLWAGVADLPRRRLRGWSATRRWPALLYPSWRRWPAATS